MSSSGASVRTGLSGSRRTRGESKSMTEEKQRVGYWIAPHFTTLDFSGPPTLEQMVLLFVDGVWGWQLDQAQRLARQPHSGLAVLSIAMSYFESIVQYRDGIVDGRGQTERLFKAGFQWVVGEAIASSEGVERIADKLYTAVRNGLYHDSLVREGIMLTDALPPNTPLTERRAPNGGIELAISPSKLVEQLQHHFARYALSLLDPNNEELRAAFAKRTTIAEEVSADASRASSARPGSSFPQPRR